MSYFCEGKSGVDDGTAMDDGADRGTTQEVASECTLCE